MTDWKMGSSNTELVHLGCLDFIRTFTEKQVMKKLGTKLEREREILSLAMLMSQSLAGVRDLFPSLRY